MFRDIRTVNSFILSFLLAGRAAGFVPVPFTSPKNSHSTTTTTTSFHTTQLQSTPSFDDEGGEENSRRGFIQKAVGGLALSGIVANGFAVQGPAPFLPSQEKNDDLTGKLIVITGGNTGLGLESGKRLAAAGATVVLTSRSAEKGSKAVKSVIEYTDDKSTGKVFTVPLDLCNLQSVKEFPEKLKESGALKESSSGMIDVLMNNAGVMAVPDLQITKDGFEKTFQSNHLGHFALTACLLPLMNTAGSRIINVSSMAYLIASKGLDMSNLNGEVDYQPWNAYGMSKLENILFTKELQRKLNEAGKKIEVAALHPGAVRTDLPRYIIGEDKFISMQDAQPTLADELKLLPAMYFTKPVERGANSQIYLSSFEGKNIGGKFFINMKETDLQPAAKDMQKASELWKASEDMAGVKFTI